ncbi:uncharacterized protein [Onthophagus taurus]|uniref:uncharacterized protein n=1 Tax=Onthophagus taurus TaxID=166361 RepID=UPI0039BE2D9A
MRPVTVPLESPNFYLPHHGVIRESSTTTKLRVVFNGSQKTSSGLSLNDCLHTGPKHQSELIDVLLRWRRHPVAFACDLEKIYCQIDVHQDDWQFQRIVWRENPSEPLQSYDLTTVTYGLSCAPYLAIRCIRQLAEEHVEEQPLGSSALFRDTYVDDIISGANDIDEVQELIFQLNRVSRAGGFLARKWISNVSEALAYVPSDLLSDTETLRVQDNNSLRALGILWNNSTDDFLFCFNNDDFDFRDLTKRKGLSFIAHLFDPLGWLSPIIVTAKIFVQNLCTCNLEWDEILPYDLSLQWNEYINSFQTCPVIRIPRWLGITRDCSSIELHGFADASSAFGAVVYLRVSSAPLKRVTIPRLELCAAVFHFSRPFRGGHRLFNFSTSDFPEEEVSVNLYSDCGTNLVGADPELRSMFSAASEEWKEMASLLSGDDTRWKFNPPGAPHFSGKWKAGVKSVKGHLRKVIGSTLLTYEEYNTVLIQIEAVLNSRPLCSISDDPNNFDVLTPGHFLIGNALTVVPEPSGFDEKISRLSRWQLLRRMVDDFWKIWERFYLQSIQNATKWFNQRNLPQIGQLVLIRDERLPPAKWSLARILQIHSGADGHARVATLKTANSTLVRPFTKLSIFPDCTN